MPISPGKGTAPTLLQHAKGIKVQPDLGDRSVDDLVYADSQRRLRASRSPACPNELALVGATKRQAVDDLVSFCNHILNGCREEPGKAVRCRNGDGFRDSFIFRAVNQWAAGSWLTAPGAKSFLHRVALPAL